MSKRGFLWVLWFCLLLASAYVVPYGLLSHYEKMTGAFLFWSVFAIVASLSIAKLISGWRDV